MPFIPDANIGVLRQNETQVRRKFVDPFFKALGWDIEKQGRIIQQSLPTDKVMIILKER
jgi:predicted type IV restriction endonuclease